ncbi:MAG: hypothetical protein EHM36_12350 [Deltaproteobacteria bacterium]|nr:MAG: hypothetical protein EHM36_12350 [Deltaproteobacteria bacterium]
MTAVALNIILDKPDRTYQSSETIKGQVKVLVEREFSAAGLLLALYSKGFSEWKRNTATFFGERTERKLFKGRWEPGEYTYPFEFVTPPGPFSYKGHVFDVTWHLGAKVQTSAEKNVTAEAEITVVPEKKAPQETGTKHSGEAVYRESPRNLKGFFGFSLVLLLVGIVVGWRNSPFAEGTETGIFFFGGVIPTVLGLALVFFTTWQALVNRRIKKVEVRLGTRQARPGDRIPCSVTFEAHLPFEVERVSAVLRGEEIVDFRKGKNSKFRKHLLHESRQELSLEIKQVPANVPVQARGEVPVPAGIPYSIDLMESDEGMALTWQIEFIIGMKKWPDWMHLEKITVLP